MSEAKKVVWITGASSGIGEALAKKYANEGYAVIISARRKEELERVKNEISFVDVRVLPLDLIDMKTFPQKCKEAIEFFGHIDILINNGGVSQRSMVIDTDLAIDRKVMEVNFFGNIALAKSILPHFKTRGKGSYVVISSLTGKFGFFLRSAYAASKHALHGFYESLRLEEQKNGIKITLVCPGFIRTDISKNALNKDGKASNEMDANQAKGMSPADCANQIYKAQQKGKLEIVIGKERIGVIIKRLFPSMFHKMIAKKSPKG